MTGGMPSSSYMDAPLILAYANAEMIREQSEVATLVIQRDKYGLAVDGVPVKELGGAFNPDLRISKSSNPNAYIVDVLPGPHKLTVTYDAMTDATGKAPTARAEQNIGGGSTASGSCGGKLFSWNRTSETSHVLKAGEVHVIGLKMMSVSGEIDLYPLEEADLGIVIATRNRANF